MCQRIGIPPISIIGLGRIVDSSEIRVPLPPANNTTFIQISYKVIRYLEATEIAFNLSTTIADFVFSISFISDTLVLMH